MIFNFYLLSIKGGGAAALFSLRGLKNFGNENFLWLKIAEIDVGVNFGVRIMILEIETHLRKFNPFSKGK